MDRRVVQPPNGATAAFDTRVKRCQGPADRGHYPKRRRLDHQPQRSFQTDSRGWSRSLAGTGATRLTGIAEELESPVESFQICEEAGRMSTLRCVLVA